MEASLPVAAAALPASHAAGFRRIEPWRTFYRRTSGGAQAADVPGWLAGGSGQVQDEGGRGGSARGRATSIQSWKMQIGRAHV